MVINKILTFYFSFLNGSSNFLSCITNIIKALCGPKYDGKYLHNLLNEKLGDKRLHQTLTNVIIPTYDIEHSCITLFSSFQVQLYHFEFIFFFFL